MRIIGSRLVFSFVVVALIHLLSGQLTSSTIPDAVRYRVPESQPASTFVGDLSRDGNLTGGSTFQIRGRHGPSSLPFSVDGRSGVIRTTGVLDREKVCPPDPVWEGGGTQPDPDLDSVECWVSFEVGVRSATTSHTIRVDVNVLDVNDNSPSFPDSQVKSHRQMQWHITLT